MEKLLNKMNYGKLTSTSSNKIHMAAARRTGQMNNQIVYNDPLFG